MRIIYLHQYFVTPDMAGGTRSYEMARRLVAAGHQVRMITSYRSGATAGSGWRVTDEAGIEVHWVTVAYSQHMGYARRMLAFAEFAIRSTLRAARAEGDVILATSTPLTIVVPALLVSAWKRIPFVFEVRDMWPDVPIAIGALRNPLLVWLARRLELLAYRRAAHVVALAPGMKEDIVSKGIPPEKVSVIPNGCDLDIFQAAGRDPRDELPWLGRRKLVLYAGSIGPITGVGYLVELAHRVSLHNPDVRFVVIGDGPDRDRVRSRAEELGILGNSFHMLAPLPKRALGPWLRTADLLMALFAGPRVVWKDAVQNKFFDALAAGRPVVSNRPGWQSIVAAEADVGLTLDADDVEGSAERLLGVLEDEVWLQGVPARARELARGRFSRDRLAESLLVVLFRVTGAKA